MGYENSAGGIPPPDGNEMLAKDDDVESLFRQIGAVAEQRSGTLASFHEGEISCSFIADNEQYVANVYINRRDRERANNNYFYDEAHGISLYRPSLEIITYEFLQIYRDGLHFELMYTPERIFCESRKDRDWQDMVRRASKDPVKFYPIRTKTESDIRSEEQYMKVDGYDIHLNMDELIAIDSVLSWISQNLKFQDMREVDVYAGLRNGYFNYREQQIAAEREERHNQYELKSAVYGEPRVYLTSAEANLFSAVLTEIAEEA